MLLGLLGSFAASTWFPVDPNEVNVTINSTFWNFAGTPAETGTWNYSAYGWTFYAKIFHPLSPGEYPSWYNRTSAFHSNVLRCSEDDRRCYSVSVIYDYFWTTEDDFNLTRGCIFESNGEPNRVESGEYDDFAARFEFRCSQNPYTGPQFSYTDVEGTRTLIGIFSAPFACGQPAAQPATPTPRPPRCLFQWRLPEAPETALIADMNELNNGLFGYSGIILNRTDPYSFNWNAILFQPCDIIQKCPWGANCDAPNSSLWICTTDGSVDERLKDCQAFGSVYANPTAQLNNVPPDAPNEPLAYGFNYNLEPQNQRDAQIFAVCEENYPLGHVMIDVGRSAVFFDHHADITIRGATFCQRQVPTPVPGPDMCTVNLTQYGPGGTGTWTLNLNLSHYNYDWSDPGPPHPWNVTVTRPPPFYTPYYLYYSPCGFELCPRGYDCGGDTDAFLYLCQASTSSGAIPQCAAFGLHQYGLTMTLHDNYIERGVDVHYEGHNARQAYVVWECNDSLAAGELRFGPFVGVEDATVGFTLQAKEVCLTGYGMTPTPPPRYVPSVPNPSPMPSPVRSPNPIRILQNDTHYIVVDLLVLEREVPWPLEVRKDMLMNGHYGETNTYWRPWEGFRAPWPGTPVPHDLENVTANMWECWLDPNVQPACFPVADKWVPGYTVTTTTPGNLDSTVIIYFPGWWNAQAAIHVPCGREPEPTMLNIEDSIQTFTLGNANPTWHFWAPSSNYFCALPFDDAWFPSPHPRGTAPSSYSNAYRYQGTVGQGDNAVHLGLNLKKIGQVTDLVLLSTGDFLSRVQVVYSPWDVIPCPDGKQCDEYTGESANVWKCYETPSDERGTYPHCFPVGDRRYGLRFAFISPSNPLTGLQVTYAGGVVGSSATFHFHCDENGTLGTVTFPSTGTEVPEGFGRDAPHHLTIMAHTKELCAEVEWGELHGGAVFLLIVFIGGILYFGFGALGYFIGTGVLSIPNEGFWLAVWDSLYTAIHFFLSCGKTAAAGPVYDRV